MNDGNGPGDDRAWLSRLGHDLRGPIGPIVTGLSLLRAGGVSPEKLAPMLDLLQRQVEVLLELVDDAAALGRMTDPTRTETTEAIALPELLDELQERVSYSLGRAGVRVECEPDSVRATLEGDERQVLRLLTFLVMRLALWAGQGGRVSIAVQPRSGALAIVLRGLGPAAQPSSLLDDALYGVVGDADGGSLSAELIRRVAQRHGIRIETPASPDAARTIEVLLPVTASP